MTKQPKPISAKTRALLSAAPSEDKLELVRAEMRAVRGMQAENADFAQRIKENNEKINKSMRETLVDLFDDAGIDNLGIVAEGNLPKLELRIGDYWHANLPDENQSAAYKYLKARGDEHLIKTKVSIEFGLGEEKETRECLDLLDKNEIAYDLKQGIPWNTLTAYVREEYAKKPLTSKVMAMLGASTGRTAVVVKQKKEK